MAGLLDDIEELSRKQSCIVGSFIATLPEEDQKDLRVAFDGPYKAPAILQVLEKRGAQFNITTLQRHRRGVCSCVAK